MYERNQFIPLVMGFILSLQFDCLPLQLPPMLFGKRRKRNGKESKAKQFNMTLFNVITTCSEECICIFIMLYYYRNDNLQWQHVSHQDSESSTCSKNSLATGCALRVGTILSGHSYAQHVEQYFLYDLKINGSYAANKYFKFQLQFCMPNQKDEVSKSQHHLLLCIADCPCFMMVLVLPVRTLQDLSPLTEN